LKKVGSFTFFLLFLLIKLFFLNEKFGYQERMDKEWGLTDCISFVVMKERKITEAFTSDRHFEQAGFTNLLQIRKPRA